MLRSALCVLLFGILVFGATPQARAGIAEYTDRGRTDFDTVVQLLNPYGTWAKIDGTWAYTPLNHYAPYTSGRWLYTEYGWYWQGKEPHSWATEHYGYWKRSANHVWSWFPGPYWLAQTVEIRVTPTHVGWRSAQVDNDGNFVEEPADRYAKTDEWVFVTRAQFAGPITPAIVAPPDVAARLLDDTTDSMHTYMTYRPIPRPGPHPADFVTLCRDGGMFAPQIYEDDVPVQKPAPPQPAPVSTNALPATSSRVVPMGGDEGTAPDTRQVRYWITMSLPSYWTPRPSDAKPTEVYMYRPEIAQDSDGIERRISLWIDPSTRKTLGVRLQDIFGVSKPKNPAEPSGPGIPAVPVTASGDPFQSPFEQSFRTNSGGTNRPSSSSKMAPSGTAVPAPSGAVSPSATNVAPDKGA